MDGKKLRPDYLILEPRRLRMIDVLNLLDFFVYIDIAEKRIMEELYHGNKRIRVDIRNVQT